MKLKTALQVIVGVLLFSILVMTASAQTGRTARMTIDVWDRSSPVITLYYGNDTSATFGIDDGTLGTVDIGETEGPPSPPTGEDVRFKPPAGHSPASWGVGLVPKDYRAIPTNPTVKDTFRIFFQNTDTPDSLFTFSWPDVSYLSLRCDSMFLEYRDVDIPQTYRINMFAQSSVDVPQFGAGGTAITLAHIYKYGSKLIDAVKEPKREGPSTPESFSLSRNYPNPFNPSTTIKFDIVQTALADLSVYNVLGQKIATLVTGQLSPGTYTTDWNGTTDNGAQVSSGVYFVRMSARVEGSGEPYVALRKLLLMK